ncbi:MAG: MFS transporter, partial [Actinomycetia bacterium]|nr:MFS transporter [Actinomycetes bacterium]
AARSGVAFALASAAQAVTVYLAGWLTDRAGRRPVLVTGSLLTATLGVGFATAGSFTWLVVLLCLYGVGASLSSTSTQAVLGDAVGPRRGPALAAYQMVGDLGVIVGPLVVGLLLDHYPAATAMSAGAALLLVTAALAAAVPRRRAAHEPRTGLR